MKPNRFPELRWLLEHVKPFARLHLASLCSSTGGSVFTLLDPLIMKWLIDRVLPAKDMRLLALGVAGFASVYIFRLALTCSGSILNFTATQKIVFRARLHLLRRIHRQSAAFHENISAGEALYRIDQDLSRLSDLAGEMLSNLARMLLVGLMSLTAMCILNYRIAALVFPLLPVCFALEKQYRAKLIAAADQAQAQQGLATGILEEHLTGIVQLQLINGHGHHAAKYARQLARAAEAQIHQRVSETRFSAAYVCLIIIASTLILGYGGHEVIRDRLTVGGLVAFYSYLTRLFEPLSIAADLQSKTQRAAASIRRILELEHVKTEGCGAPMRLSLQSTPVLEFRGVSFRYRDRAVAIDCINLRVEAGERIALVGRSGCGKTTIANLAVGMYRPDAGSVLLNGEDIRHFSRRSLRSVVSLVTQEPVLFDGTLRENLLYGDRRASTDELECVLRFAQLGVLVQALPRGLDEPLGPRARTLSGGERKRVALARAILGRPRILILDELTSGLDKLTATHLLRSLEEFQPGTTLILISHTREATIFAGRILVVSNGGILDQGSHVDLITRCSLYRELNRRREQSPIPEQTSCDFR